MSDKYLLNNKLLSTSVDSEIVISLAQCKGKPTGKLVDQLLMLSLYKPYEQDTYNNSASQKFEK